MKRYKITFNLKEPAEIHVMTIHINEDEDVIEHVQKYFFHDTFDGFVIHFGSEPLEKGMLVPNERLKSIFIEEEPSQS